MIIWILASTLIVSLISLIGVLAFALKDNLLNKIIASLVSLAIGALFGGAFLHLIPEAIKLSKNESVYLFIIAGFVIFFLIEKVLHWRHCHRGHCPVHTFAYMSIIGDGLHNFIDGLIIATAFVSDFRLGIIATLAIILHEIPQELGDFGILIYAGFSRKKAILYNFLSAIIAVLGGVAGYFLVSHVDSVLVFVLALAAGGFIYIAATDLIPELRQEKNVKKSILNFAIIILGIALMYLLKFIGA